MRFDETATRELVAALASECGRLQRLLSGYRAAIEVYFSKYPEAIKEIRSQVTVLSQDPRTKEIVGQRFAACFELATHGLNDAEAQALLDRAGAIADSFHDEEDN